MYDKPLSYSGMSLYKKCPRAWKDAYIDGNRSVPGPAAMRGTALHQQLEGYFNGRPYPHGDRVLKYWWMQMEQLAKMTCSAELGLAVDWGWNPCEFDSPDAALRGNVDLIIEQGELVRVFDWKSGKEYPSHKDQSDIYAALAWYTYPEAERIEVTMVYLDNPHYTVLRKYDHDAVMRLAVEIGGIIEAIREDEEYAPTPSNDACRYCALSWRKGGSCDKSP